MAAVLVSESSPRLWAEFWVSLASLLRTYTAAHSLNGKHQATVELGEDRIILRTGDRWLQLDRSQAEVLWAREDGSKGLMRFTIEGRLQTQDKDQGEEMDLQAELWARELMR